MVEEVKRELSPEEVKEVYLDSWMGYYCKTRKDMDPTLTELARSENMFWRLGFLKSAFALALLPFGMFFPKRKTIEDHGVVIDWIPIVQKQELQAYIDISGFNFVITWLSGGLVTVIHHGKQWTREPDDGQWLVFRNGDCGGIKFRLVDDVEMKIDIAWFFVSDRPINFREWKEDRLQYENAKDGECVPVHDPRNLLSLREVGFGACELLRIAG